MNIKLLNDLAKIPERSTSGAAGYDISAAIGQTIYIPPHCTVKIPTGIAMEIPAGHWVGIFPRSGLSTKQGLRLANCVAVIDEDYRGEIAVPIHNDTNAGQKIEPGQRIAQYIILPYVIDDPLPVEALSNTVRGENGFGSTGV